MMINEVTEVENTGQNGGKKIYELKAKRKKGRPRKSQIKSSFENSIKRKCKICQKLGFDANHMTGLCKYYNRIIEIGKEINASNKELQGKRCSLCKCPGHTCRKCQSLIILTDEINSEK